MEKQQRNFRQEQQSLRIKIFSTATISQRRIFHTSSNQEQNKGPLPLKVIDPTNNNDTRKLSFTRH